jgi:ferrochelatase
LPRYLPEPVFEHGTAARPGVLLVNLGTPEAPTPAAVRHYLKQFLSDPRVVEIPRAVWLPILHGIILNTRPKDSAARYARIWTAAGSPLKVHTENQAKLLRGFLRDRVKTPPGISWAMRYGEPSVAAGIQALRAEGCDRIVVLPLYPQYAASTTAAVFDATFAALARIRNAPAIRTVRHFHDDPGYIAALVQSIRDYWAKTAGRPDKLVLSFHGVPRHTLDKGDPYHCECHKTARLIAEGLGLTAEQWTITFQSRFGRAEWLKPYTAGTLITLGRAGTRRVDVACPGFVSDCLETLEEIAFEARETFLSAGGSEFHYIPCLNERDDWIRALVGIVLRNLLGWVEETPDATALAASSRRALALGALR